MKSSKSIMNHFKILGGMTPRTTKNPIRLIPIKIAFSPAVPLLGIYPDKTLILKDTCTPMFIVALFTIGKTW